MARVLRVLEIMNEAFRVKWYKFGNMLELVYHQCPVAKS